jgi:hypothetical protein
MPGVRRAAIQNCCVDGPRITVCLVITPIATSFPIVSYEQPGKCGRLGSRTNHGPMSFWVAWRVRESTSTWQAEQRVPASWTCPQ